MEVIEVTPYKKRYKVKFSNHTEILLSYKELKKNHCEQGNVLEEEQWNRFIVHLIGRGKERALYLLDRSEQTEKQIRDLLTKGVTNKITFKSKSGEDYQGYLSFDNDKRINFTFANSKKKGSK